MNKVDYAVDCFNREFNCSQAVFTAFCEDFGLEKKLGLKIAGSFGAINCTALLAHDLSDEKQLNAERQTDVFITKCPKYVKDAVELLEVMMAEHGGMNR